VLLYLSFTTPPLPNAKSPKYRELSGAMDDSKEQDVCFQNMCVSISNHVACIISILMHAGAVQLLGLYSTLQKVLQPHFKF
jgi:hypothetical protein